MVLRRSRQILWCLLVFLVVLTSPLDDADVRNVGTGVGTCLGGWVRVADEGGILVQKMEILPQEEMVFGVPERAGKGESS